MIREARRFLSGLAVFQIFHAIMPGKMVSLDLGIIQADLTRTVDVRAVKMSKMKRLRRCADGTYHKVKENAEAIHGPTNDEIPMDHPWTCAELTKHPCEGIVDSESVRAAQ